MRRIQRLNRFQNSVAIAAVAVGLVASASVPAAAHTRTALLPFRATQEHVQTHRQFTYAPNGLKGICGRAAGLLRFAKRRLRKLSFQLDPVCGRKACGCPRAACTPAALRWKAGF